jgi:hypothetical protein
VVARVARVVRDGLQVPAEGLGRLLKPDVMTRTASTLAPSQSTVLPFGGALVRRDVAVERRDLLGERIRDRGGCRGPGIAGRGRRRAPRLS